MSNCGETILGAPEHKPRTPIGAARAVAPHLPVVSGFDRQSSKAGGPGWAPSFIDVEADDSKEAEPLLEPSWVLSANFHESVEDGSGHSPKRKKAKKKSKRDDREPSDASTKAASTKAKSGNSSVSMTRLLLEGRSEWFRLACGTVCLFAAAGCNLVVPTLFGRILDALTTPSDNNTATGIAQTSCATLVCKYASGAHLHCFSCGWRHCC